MVVARRCVSRSLSRRRTRSATERRRSRPSPEALPPLDQLLAEIDDATGTDRDLDTDRHILRLRHQAGIQLLDEAAHHKTLRSQVPDFDALPNGGEPVEITPGEMTPELLRAAILTHGCLLVRGLIERNAALELSHRHRHRVRRRAPRLPPRSSGPRRATTSSSSRSRLSRSGGPG